MNKFLKKYWSFRNWFRDNIFEPIWYRIFGHKFHIVKTGLKPSPWYDTDIRMLYAVMSLVEWFVENDMRIWSQEDRDKELKRIREEENPEYQKDFIDCLEDQFSRNDKIVSIYKWWKNYSNRQEEVEKSLHDWYVYNEKFLVDSKDRFSNRNPIFGNKKPMSKEEKTEERRLLDYHVGLENKLINEEKEYMKLAVDLKDSMWS